MRIRFNIAGINAIEEEHILMKKIEFAQVKKQVEVLATFLPDEILKMRHELEETHNYVGVLLFADVSGFTQLTEKYNKTGKGGIYRLTATLNAYIGAIIEILYFYGGDVLKFSGDAFLALWKVMPNESLFEILHGVVVCALVIQHALGHFETEVNVELKVKLAISCGNMTFCVIGDRFSKHYIIAGEAINDVKAAEQNSIPGDVVISAGAWAHMLQERYDTTPGVNGNAKVWAILYKPNEVGKKFLYHEMQVDALKLIEAHIAHRNALHATKKFNSNLSDSKITERFIRTLPQRTQMKLAPRSWIVEDLRPFIIKPVQDLVDESQPVEYLTEMREVTVQFINIIPLIYTEPMLIDLVDKAYQIVCQIALSALGVVNKVSLFDKDAMILVLFGLRAINHEMESQNALRSAYKIRTAISKLEIVKSVSIGVTNGFVYCGVVGHPMRREYTVIGSAVNKAARIMCSYIDKVTCDHKTFRLSKLSSYYFQLQTAMKLKGIEEAGNIFEYNEDFETSSYVEKESLHTVGRSTEYNIIRSVVRNTNKSGYYGICLCGPTKIGKSKILQTALTEFKNTNSYIIASVALEGSGLIPYFCISKLYRQLYDKRTTIINNDVEIINQPRDLWNFQEAVQNQYEDIALQKYRILNYFRDICKCSNSRITLIFIDNIECIDLQSWEILEISLSDWNIRLISAGTFDEKNWNLKFKLSVNNSIMLIDVKPVDKYHVATIACQFLAVAGMPKILVELLIRSCDGRPGYIQCCLLRLVNNGSLELQFITNHDEYADYVFPSNGLPGISDSKIIPIIQFSEKYKRSNDELTLAAISLDLFDSFTPYQQLVIKTGAVLGDLFTRTLLIVALKYPTELILAKVIDQLFQEEILECGSRYIYATELDQTNQLCCHCYFEEEFIHSNVASGLPKYAFCKILHFKNKSIRDVAYDLLPSNQRKELHVLCTDVLENISNKCPNCLRNPLMYYVNLGKYKDVMRYCNNPTMKTTPTEYEYGNYDDLKECIRNCMRRNIYNLSKEERTRRPVFDPKLCNCFDILGRVYNDLIYHSHKAEHLGKEIFFTLKYGLILIVMKDFGNAISLLVEAKELCLNDLKIPNSHMTGVFRRVNVGKIETGLAVCYIHLRQLRAARNHLSVALRQYNIPSVALRYKHFNKLLTRSFLVNTKRMRPVLCKNTIIRNDMGACLACCAKLFIYEGNWKLAKLASAYSLYLFRSINTKVNILCESYCSAIDFARYSQDSHTCEKLQKYAVLEFQMNYCNNLTYNMHSLNIFLFNLFEIKNVSGDICGAIRLGYRVLDITMKNSVMIVLSGNLLNLVVLLVYNFRILDAGDVAKLLKKNGEDGNLSINILIYHSLNVLVYMRSGFAIDSIEESLEFGKKYFSRKVRFSWLEYHYMSIIYLYYLRINKYDLADHWRHSCSFNPINVRRLVVFRTLVTSIEGKILQYLRNRRMKNTNIKIEEKIIFNLINLANKQHNYFKVYTPECLCLTAWMKMIKNKKRAAFKLLKKAEAACETQNNYMIYSLILQLRNTWTGGYHFKYTDRPVLSYKEAATFSPKSWAQYMSPLPLD